MLRCLPLLLMTASLFAQETEEPAFVVAGTVQRPDGKPAEAAVFLWDALAADRPLAQGRTDQTGAFRLEVSLVAAARREHPFGPVRVVVHEPGLARAERTVTPGAQETLFRLVKPADWSGVVKSRAGEPLPGAPVIAEQGSLRIATTTDEQGGFSFVDLGPGRTRVTADAGGYRAATIESGALEFSLEPLPVVTGQVVDSETLQPLAQVYIVALDAGVAAESDGEGRFRMELEGGRGMVAAYLDGYAIARLEFGGGAIPLARAEPVRGVVVDPKGEPVAFAPVRLDPGFGDPRLARTNEAGAFEFPVGVTGIAFVDVERRGYLPARAIVDAGWQADRVRVELRRGRGVEGSVLRDGEPEMGAAVFFYRRVEPHGRAEVARAYADAEGQFRVAALPPEAAFARAEGGGAGSVDVPVEKRMWLRLEQHPPVTGILRDDAGDPVAGVALALDVEPRRSTRSGDDGTFEFPDLPAGTYELLFAETDMFLGARRTVAPGHRVELVVERKRGSHSLSIAVPTARSGMARVLLRGDGWERARWLPPADREVEFEALASGVYRLRIEAAGYQDAEREVTVADGAEASRVEVALPRAGTLRFTATARASVLIVTLDGEPAPTQALKLESGEAQVAGFGPGRYRFLSRAPGEAIVVREVEVGAKDPPRDVDLTGGPAATLEVLVTDARGAPVRGVSIDLVTRGGFPYRTGIKTDENGKATLTRLILGPVALIATKGDARAEKPIEVEPGARLEAKLVLE